MSRENDEVTDRCNKPLPGGRFLCDKPANHEGRCARHWDLTCGIGDRVWFQGKPPEKKESEER